jgi:hypothetical protein
MKSVSMGVRLLWFRFLLRFTAHDSEFSTADSIFSWLELIKEVSLTGLTQNYTCYLKGSISISNSPSITDVSCFKNAKVLEFYRCPNITDVSSLGHVYKLVLSHCDGITDVSTLGKCIIWIYPIVPMLLTFLL